ncbi:GNAT family N-acetyltransferase [Arthrobacter sp. B3I4]|uniref:GNAT family N-acetyltransferase n=1 Tax=Arthrobacter sp. B3I4 TaxID=3042267 RepID=UPI00277F09CD|nr:GNAT family N-acetyltransferase [Arthrobacter sp. B3I4]MDQ0756771.1 GNAT superfamily N-acetyltransferase [Arthrobacter sp. B3I4]
MAAHVWLIALKDLDGDARAVKLGEVAELELGEGQGRFVGDPLRMALAGLEDDSRFPYVLDANGSAVGVATLQSGAARAAGWADNDSAWLLRGFLVDRRQQGRGFGAAASAAAVREAGRLTRVLGGGQRGVVLSVNEANPAGQAAYRKAGFEDCGQYLGGDAGAQRIFYRSF